MSRNCDFSPIEETQFETSTRHRKCSCKCLGIIAVIICLCVSVILLIHFTFRAASYEYVTTTIDCGQVKGKQDVETGVSTFFGIKYADTPSRWRVPETLSKEYGNCWSGEYDATYYREQCAQIDPYHKIFAGSEDCLYLNIWTPSLKADSKLPVMVYLHGGYMMFLNASMDGYSPDVPNTKKHNVVYVSVEFRMNAIGYLVVDPIEDQKGNYGLWDQIEALKWIQRNIVSFGGDPEQVTLFGQSSGGTSIFALMASPHATGLFSKAWSLSGSPNFPLSLQQAAPKNKPFLEEFNCSDIQCLRNVSAEKIVTLADKLWNIDYLTNLPTLTEDLYSLIVIDGDLLPSSPSVAWEKEEKDDIPDVPLLVGVTAQEIDYFPLPLISEIPTWSKDDYTSYTKKCLDTFGGNITQEALRLYPFTPDPEEAWSTMVSDVRMVCSVHQLSLVASRSIQSPVYFYVVTSRPANPVHMFDLPWAARYSLHNWDLAAFWGHLAKWMDGEPSQENIKFAKIVEDNVLSFVRSGKVKDWKTVDEETALLNATVEVIQRYHREECDFWLDNHFGGHSWVN